VVELRCGQHVDRTDGGDDDYAVDLVFSELLHVLGLISCLAAVGAVADYFVRLQSEPGTLSKTNNRLQVIGIPTTRACRTTDPTATHTVRAYRVAARWRARCPESFMESPCNLQALQLVSRDHGVS
jgi:hypothetical protein